MGQFKNWRDGVEAMKEKANQSQGARQSIVRAGVSIVQHQSTGGQVGFLSQALNEGRVSAGKLA